jgi:chemotaxis response regulator CheB
LEALEQFLRHLPAGSGMAFVVVQHLDDLHGRGSREQFHQHPLVGGVQVLNDDKGHATASGQVAQELLKGLQSPGGGANADDGE